MLIVGMCFVSCDTPSTLFVNDLPSYSISTECGSVTVTGTTMLSDYITFSFIGDFVVNVDSLKLIMNDNSVKRTNVRVLYKKKILDNSRKMVHINGNDTISVAIKNSLSLKYGKKDLLEIIPSTFILCNNVPLISDVIRIRKK
jgi:hypothetical protein